MTTSTATTATDALLTRAEAAARLGITARALGQLAYKGTGPAYIVIGERTVRYRQADLDAYVEGRVRQQSGSPA